MFGKMLEKWFAFFPRCFARLESLTIFFAKICLLRMQHTEPIAVESDKKSGDKKSVNFYKWEKCLKEGT